MNLIKMILAALVALGMTIFLGLFSPILVYFRRLRCKTGLHHFHLIEYYQYTTVAKVECCACAKAFLLHWRGTLKGNYEEFTKEHDIRLKLLSKYRRGENRKNAN